MEKRELGIVGVDSGLMFIIDPCYIRRQKALTDGDQWDKFLQQLPTDKRGEVCDGVVIQTESGDGGYPVIGHFDELGRLKKIEIKF